MDNKFVKLSELVEENFTILKVHPYKFKLWDIENRKMLVSEVWEKGYRKVYTVDTDKGALDLGAGQMGNILEAVMFDGKVDLNGVTIKVKSNGKSGMDIRYFFNFVKPEKASEPASRQASVDKDDPWVGML